MPHLNYHGLDQIWLLKTLGNNHWDMLSSIPAFTKDNERLYASFYGCSIDFNKGQDAYKEGETLAVDSNIYKFNNLIYRSNHVVTGPHNVTTATFDSIFVKKDVNTNGLIKDEPVHNVRTIESIDSVFIEEHKRVKKEFQTFDFNSLVKLQFNPETLFNSVKILYFANYLQLVSQSEYQKFAEIQAPIKKILIYYFGNIAVTDSVYGITEKNNNIYTTTLIANNKVIAVCTITR